MKKGQITLSENKVKFLESSSPLGITISQPKKLDTKKIKTIEDVVAILDCLDLYVRVDHSDYEKVKHLVVEEE